MHINAPVNILLNKKQNLNITLQKVLYAKN